MAKEMTLDELKRMAARVGLNLSEEDLRKLLPGVDRSRKQVTELRQLLSDTGEPAGSFSTVKGLSK
ncbi:MAG: hypothetical protein WD688_23425 [Candidatus Binatia bacterium]